MQMFSGCNVKWHGDLNAMVTSFITNHYISLHHGMIMRLIALFMTLTLALGVMPMWSEGMSPRREVVDPYLAQILAEATQHERIEIIVQFDDLSLGLAVLKDLGFDLREIFRPISGAFAVGTRDDILRLSAQKTVKWIEFNEPLSYFLEVSTSVIGASQVWKSVLREDGNIIDDDGGWAYRIDGRGVTVVILDTGIDAGHPDLDYLTKTIINRKREENGWTEMKNSDTSSGHGTHCAGIAAGNGDASAGQRRGVAPGANLIGLSTGEGLSIVYALEGLVWVYENSKPNQNQWNIRVVSNSWGTSGDHYDPEDAITKVVERLVYENHVAVVFAAGNDGGDGSEIRTNPYANIPAAIGVAASERDGSGIAEFSSRGHRDYEDTWPDVAAPGVNIWSAAPRGTLIDMAQRPSDDDLYYMAISGTSMATPHVSGAVALLYQVAPHLSVSDVHEDFSGMEGKTEGQWYSDPDTRISEAELILEATATYINGPGVPSDNRTNEFGWRHDFAQGYGIINVTRAVEVALTLEHLRTYDGNRDGVPDTPDATVLDALEKANITYRGILPRQTDRLRSTWHGEWAHFTKQDIHPAGNAVYATNSTVRLLVPVNAERLSISFQYEASSANEYYASDLNLAIDMNGDGMNDVPTPTSVSEGVKTYEIDVSRENAGRYWSFWVDGQAFGYNLGDEYFEPTVNFDVSVEIDIRPDSVSILPKPPPDTDIAVLEFGEPSDGNTTVYLMTNVFEPSLITPEAPEIVKEKETRVIIPWFPLFTILFLTASAGVVTGYLIRKRRTH